MRITIEPTPVRDMNPDDFFRDGGRSIRIAGFERDEEAVEVFYFVEGSGLVCSFYLKPDDTLDKVIDEES